MRTSLGPYLSIFAARYRLLLQYRTAAIAGLFTQFFFGLVKVMGLQAFYASSNHPQPIDLPQVITYIWLGQAFFALIPWSIDRELAALIRNGGVVYELMRPMDLYAAWFARGTSQRVAPATLRCGPIFLIALLSGSMQLPASAQAGGACVIALVGSVLLGTAITVIATMSLMWTVAGDGIIRLLPVMVLVCSGMIVPLPLMPDSLQQLLAFLPFSCLVDEPFRLYTGNLPASAVGWILLKEFVWTSVLIVIGRALLSRGLRRLVLQGG